MRKEDYLKKYFGYTEFRKGQEEIVSSLLSGKDVCAIMPTGAGKSLCYQLCIILVVICRCGLRSQRQTSGKQNENEQ